MAERFITCTDLAAKLMAQLDAETMYVPPPPKVNFFLECRESLFSFLVLTRSLFHQDTEAKKAKKAHVWPRKLKGDVERAQATEKVAKAPSKFVSKASDKASSGISSESKRRVEVPTEGILVEYEEPPQKRSERTSLGPMLPLLPSPKLKKWPELGPPSRLSTRTLMMRPFWTWAVGRSTPCMNLGSR